MTTIDTSEKGWQKAMAECMTNSESFTLVTTDHDLAEALQKGHLTVREAKLLFLGSKHTVEGHTVHRIQSTAGALSFIALSIGFVAGANPEPISKTILSIIYILVGGLGLYFIYDILKRLINKDYIFVLKYKSNDKKYMLLGQPTYSHPTQRLPN